MSLTPEEIEEMRQISEDTGEYLYPLIVQKLWLKYSNDDILLRSFCSSYPFLNNITPVVLNQVKYQNCLNDILENDLVLIIMNLTGRFDHFKTNWEIMRPEKFTELVNNEWDILANNLREKQLEESTPLAIRFPQLNLIVEDDLEQTKINIMAYDRKLFNYDNFYFTDDYLTRRIDELKLEKSAIEMSSGTNTLLASQFNLECWNLFYKKVSDGSLFKIQAEKIKPLQPSIRQYALYYHYLQESDNYPQFPSGEKMVKCKEIGENHGISVKNFQLSYNEITNNKTGEQERKRVPKDIEVAIEMLSEYPTAQDKARLDLNPFKNV